MSSALQTPAAIWVNADVQSSSGQDHSAPKQRFKLIPFDKLLLGSAVTYLVKGIIPRTGLVVIWGPPKCGKSFWVFDLMMHVALGWEYRGRKVRGGLVVYCALEGAEGFKARAEAWRQRHLAEQSEPVAFHLMSAPLNLVADHGALASSIRAQIGDVRPAAVVIDTLNRSLAGSESKDEDMAAYVRAADAIRDAFGCAVIIVHHSGIDASRPRGHTSLTGAADAQISVKRDAASNVVVEVEYMKDGPEGDTFTSRLESVEVGTDDDGDPITSCVIVPAESVEGDAAKAKPKLPKGAQIALRALSQAVDECGEIPPASNHIPPGLRVCSIERWRDYAYRLGISTSEEPRARQLAFKRASEVLIAVKSIAVWEPYVWPAWADNPVAAESRANLIAQANR